LVIKAFVLPPAARLLIRVPFESIQPECSGIVSVVTAGVKGRTLGSHLERFHKHDRPALGKPALLAAVSLHISASRLGMRSNMVFAPPSRGVEVDRIRIFLLSFVAVGALACTSVSPVAGPTAQVPASGQPTISVSSPVNGAVVPLGAPVAVVSSATDAVGVSRIDLAVDGVVVDSYSTPGSVGQPNVAAQLSWTPAAAGAHALAAIAYRPDGTASAPAVIAVSVTDTGASFAATPSTSFGLPTVAPPSNELPTIEPAPTVDPVTPTLTPTVRPTRRPRPTVTPTPDLVYIDVWPRDPVYTPYTNDPAAGYHVDVEFKIANSASDRARRFTVSATCLGYTQTQEVSGIDAFESDYIIAFGFYASLAGVESPQRAVVDSTDRLVETDESNNTLALDDPSCAPPP
jgi:hypothetical protein